jgi:hypothetical protein
VSEVYPEIAEWFVPTKASEATLAGVAEAGRARKESGAFWLGPRAGTSSVTDVVLPSGDGVEESADYWRVAPEVFGAISRWAKPLDLTLLAIVHTHIRGVPPRLSWADRHRSVRVPGILSVIIGNGGEDKIHERWGWYIFDTDDYRELRREELSERVHWIESGVRVWRADRHGVWTK